MNKSTKRVVGWGAGMGIGAALLVLIAILVMILTAEPAAQSDITKFADDTGAVNGAPVDSHALNE